MTKNPLVIHAVIEMAEDINLGKDTDDMDLRFDLNHRKSTEVKDAVLANLAYIEENTAYKIGSFEVTNSGNTFTSEDCQETDTDWRDEVKELGDCEDTYTVFFTLYHVRQPL